MHFSSGIVRPPYEAWSTFLQVTSGCSHNKCRFCTFYKDAAFRVSPEEEIRAYVDSGEPMDKAGSYAIQGTYGKYVKEFRGSKANIIGFPWERFEEEIRDWR